MIGNSSFFACLPQFKSKCKTSFNVVITGPDTTVVYTTALTDCWLLLALFFLFKCWKKQAYKVQLSWNYLLLLSISTTNEVYFMISFFYHYHGLSQIYQYQGIVFLEITMQKKMLVIMFVWCLIHGFGGSLQKLCVYRPIYCCWNVLLPNKKSCIGQAIIVRKLRGYTCIIMLWKYHYISGIKWSKE